MNKKEKEKQRREELRRSIEEFMKRDGYRYAGEGDSPYSQEFVDSIMNRKDEKSEED